MRRHFIYVGDRTAVGGVVVEGLATFTLMGRSVAYHGAKIECPACESIGNLHCLEPRLPYTLPNGAKVGLEQDVCICKCRVPPRLMASQSAVFMEVGASNRSNSPGLATTGLVAEMVSGLTAREQVFRGRFQVINDHTRQPAAGVAVRVRSASGQSVDCTTDDEGYTAWIETEQDEELFIDRWWEGES